MQREREEGQADRSGHLVLHSGVSLSLRGEKRATLHSRATRVLLAEKLDESCNAALDQRSTLPSIFTSPNRGRPVHARTVVCHQFLVDFEITGLIVRANLPRNKFPARRAGVISPE